MASMDVGINIEVGHEIFGLMDVVDEIMSLVDVEYINDAYLLRTEFNNILAEMVVVK